MIKVEASLSDVLDSGRSVHFQLARPLAQEELDGRKVSLVDLDVLFKLGPTSELASCVERWVSRSHLAKALK